MTSDRSMALFQPQPSGLTAPFWAGAANNRLILTRCVDCREWQHPPLELCRRCGGDLDPEEAPLHGVVYSATITHHPAVPLYPVPYQVAVVEVGGSGGPRIVARVLDDEPLDPDTPVRIEMSQLPGGNFRVPVVTMIEGHDA